MMGRDVFVTQTFAKQVANTLSQAPRVNENKRRAMRVYQLHEALVNLVPHFVGRYRTKFS